MGYINDYTVNSIINAIDNNKIKVNNDFVMPKYIKIGKISIYGLGSDMVLLSNDDVNDTYYKKWLGDIGGFLKKDIKKNNIESYKELLTNGTRSIIKMVDIDDYDFIIGDNKYVLIKTVSIDNDYSIECGFNNELEVPFVKTNEEKEEEIDEKINEEETPECYSLF